MTLEDFLWHFLTKGLDDVITKLNISQNDLNLPSISTMAVRTILDWHWNQITLEISREILALSACYSEANTIPIERLQLLVDAVPDASGIEQPFEDAFQELANYELIEV